MARKREKQCDGGFLNTSISEQSLYLFDGLNIDKQSFLDDAGLILGRAKLDIQVRETRNSAQEDVIHLEKMERLIKNLVDEINLTSLNQNAYMLEAWYKMGLSSLLDEELKSSLIKYQCSIIYSKEEIKKYSNLKGRNTNHIEANLVCTINFLFEKCKTGKVKAEDKYSFISDFLRLNQIPTVPKDIDKIRKIISKNKNR